MSRPWWRPGTPPKPPKPVITVGRLSAAPTPASLPEGTVDVHLVAAQRALQILLGPGSMTRKRHWAATSLRIDRHTADERRRHP